MYRRPVLLSRVRRKGRLSTPSVGAFLPQVPPFDEAAFAESLNALEAAVQSLRQRFDQVRDLQRQQQTVKGRLQDPHLPEADLQALQRELENLTLALDSTVVSWRSLSEPFWQAVRFGGLGLVIGWMLRAIAIRN
jgi:cell division FtsZ-interacting protein ZapD